MAFVQQFGWDVGNRLNKELATKMGKVAMHHLMKELGVTGVKDVLEFRHILEIALGLFYPWPDFEFEFE